MNTSSLLTLSSVFQSLTELGTVKKHLLRASREVLLAIQSLLDFADQHIGNLSTQEEHQQKLHGAITFAQNTLKRVTKQLPRGDDELYRTIHRKVMNSILEVLEGEIRKQERHKTQKSKMKVEVFQAIRNVLLKEMYEQETGTKHEHTT